MRTLADSFLQSLVARLDDENTIGFTLAGSFARREDVDYSDVDIHQYVRKLPEKRADRYYLRYLDGYLVAVSLVLCEDENASLRDPRKAIWAIPGLCQERLLLDKEGSIAALKEAAAKTNLEQLQQDANAYASWNLACIAEEAHKILAGLVQQDESRTIYALWGLTEDLSTTLLVQRGILVPSENTYFDLVQAVAGRESNWTRQFRWAVGLDPLPVQQPPWYSRGVAGLRLYYETARLLHSILLPEDAVVVERTVELITEARY